MRDTVDVKKEIERRLKDAEYRYRQRERTLAHEQVRRQAWNTSVCKSMYNQLIAFAGGEAVVRPGKRAEAKQIAITAYMRGQTLDQSILQRFRGGVEIANGIAQKRGQGRNCAND